MNGITSAAPIRGCPPSCCVMSISSTAARRPGQRAAPDGVGIAEHRGVEPVVVGVGLGVDDASAGHLQRLDDRVDHVGAPALAEVRHDAVELTVGHRPSIGKGRADGPAPSTIVRNAAVRRAASPSRDRAATAPRPSPVRCRPRPRPRPSRRRWRQPASRIASPIVPRRGLTAGEVTTPTCCAVLRDRGAVVGHRVALDLQGLEPLRRVRAVGGERLGADVLGVGLDELVHRQVPRRDLAGVVVHGDDDQPDLGAGQVDRGETERHAAGRDQRVPDRLRVLGRR